MKSKNFILEVIDKDGMLLFLLRDPRNGQLVKITSNVNDFDSLLDD